MRSTSLVDEERELVAEALNNLSADSADRFDECKSTHRFLAFRRKQLVVYRLLFDTPSVVDTLTCEEAGFDLDKGMSSVWRNASNHNITVTSIPVEVYPSVFLWHTFNSDVIYQVYKGVRSGKFSMLYRSPHHPKYRFENYIYIQELASFESEFGKQ